MALKLAVCGLLLCAGMHLPHFAFAQADKAVRPRAAAKAEQPPAEVAVSTGDNAIDLLINSQVESAAASAPAGETLKARRAARASSAAEVADQSFRDALLHEAALAVANQTRTDETPIQVVHVPAEEAAESKSRSQQTGTGDDSNETTWIAAVRSAVATLRENRYWLLMAAAALAALAIAASLARNGAFRGSGSGPAGPDRRGGADRRIDSGPVGRGDVGGTLSRRTAPRRQDVA